MWPFKAKQKVSVLLVVGYVFASLVFVNIIIYLFWIQSEIKIEDFVDRQEASAGPLIMQTDKNNYTLGNLVKISYSNQALEAIAEAPSTQLSVESSRFLGQNYGVGLIEKFINEKWLAVEPVCRCSLDCFSACKEERRIPKTAMKTFYWKQTMLVCSALGEEDEVVNVGPGRYRVVSAVWDNKASDYKLIYSNQFEIK